MYYGSPHPQSSAEEIKEEDLNANSDNCSCNKYIVQAYLPAV